MWRNLQLRGVIKLDKKMDLKGARVNEELIKE